MAPLPTPPTQPPATHHLLSWGSIPISLYTELSESLTLCSNPSPAIFFLCDLEKMTSVCQGIPEK